MHGGKELFEKLGRNDPCPCGSGRRFQLLQVLTQNGTVDLYARLQFSEEDVNSFRAKFFGVSGYSWEEESDEDPDLVYTPPEGKIILLFSKPAS